MSIIILKPPFKILRISLFSIERSVWMSAKRTLEYKMYLFLIRSGLLNHVKVIGKESDRATRFEMLNKLRHKLDIYILIRNSSKFVYFNNRNGNGNI